MACFWQCCEESSVNGPSGRRKTAVNQVHVFCLLLRKRCSGNASLKSRAETLGRSEPAFPSGRPTSLGNIDPIPERCPRRRGLKGLFCVLHKRWFFHPERWPLWVLEGILIQRSVLGSRVHKSSEGNLGPSAPRPLLTGPICVDNSTDRQSSSGVSLMHSSCVGSPPTG